MFEALKTEVESLLHVPAYPLIGPQTQGEFVTLQLISDPPIESGTIRTRLVAARYQLAFISPRYSRTVEMDAALWSQWGTLTHGYVGGYPVQYVERGNLAESYEPDDGGLYRRARDFTFYCEEGAT